MSKVLEKIVAAQLCDHLHKKNLFEEFQSGFRVHCSTAAALVKATNDLLFVTIMFVCVVTLVSES